VRAVLDPNVLIAALLSPRGTPAQIVSRWLSGEFELILSETLLSELRRSLAYPKIRGRVPAASAAEFIALLRESAVVALDPTEVACRSVDAGDDYLLALAEKQQAVLVSGDRHLLALAAELPVRTPREFADVLG
jgi:putative PIN family toxin of toxin-antitoxin system